ncbi:zinc carboxypeptidase-like [Mytilus edulis]|uniref:zinc carboxypeptidase-like n=1 Tax=Mytilus edulis TaxID=6550 RepID=UPI0039F03564
MKFPLFLKICPPKAAVMYTFITKSELFCFVSVILFFLDFCSTIDVKAQREKYIPDYSVYHNYSMLHREITQIVKRNPNFMRIEKEYESRNKVSQLVLHITNFTGSFNTQISKYTGNSRLKILFSYGVHAREFLPTESLLYLLKNLTKGLTFPHGSFEEQFSHYVLSHIDIYIISVANPDGRLYLESTNNYCWRGTETGVDLDRNFDWEYGRKGSSSDPKDEEYRGLHKFSEPESLAFTDLTEKIKFDLFMSFHSGIKHIYIPFADTKSKKIGRQVDNFADMLDLAMELSHCTKYTYKYGQAYKLNDYTADGTIFDFMAGVRKIPFSYTVELWGQNHKGTSCFDLFNPPNEDLKEVLETIHPLYVQLFRYMIDWKSSQVSHITEDFNEESSLNFGYILMMLSACLTFFVCLTGKNRFHHRRRIVSLKSLGSSFSASFMKA